MDSCAIMRIEKSLKHERHETVPLDLTLMTTLRYDNQSTKISKRSIYHISVVFTIVNCIYCIFVVFTIVNCKYCVFVVFTTYMMYITQVTHFCKLLNLGHAQS